MNLEHLIEQHRQAQKLVEILELQIADARNSDEGAIVVEIAQIDEVINNLETERLVLETRLAQMRLAKRSVDKMTVREASLATGMGEMTIRTISNPKRARRIRIIKEGHKTFICVDSLYDYMHK